MRCNSAEAKLWSCAFKSKGAFGSCAELEPPGMLKRGQSLNRTVTDTGEAGVDRQAKIHSEAVGWGLEDPVKAADARSEVDRTLAESLFSLCSSSMSYLISLASIYPAAPSPPRRIYVTILMFPWQSNPTFNFKKNWVYTVYVCGICQRMCVACQYLCVHTYAVLMLMCILVEDRESPRSCFTSSLFSPYFSELEYLIIPGAGLVARKSQRSLQTVLGLWTPLWCPAFSVSTGDLNPSLKAYSKLPYQWMNPPHQL